jgi:hypothetical protein
VSLVPGVLMSVLLVGLFSISAAHESFGVLCALEVFMCSVFSEGILSRFPAMVVTRSPRRGLSDIMSIFFFTFDLFFWYRRRAEISLVGCWGWISYN